MSGKDIHEIDEELSEAYFKGFLMGKNLKNLSK